MEPTVVSNLAIANLSICDFFNLFRNFIKNDNLFYLYEKIHINFLASLLSRHNIFCPSENQRFVVRKFIVFVLWSCPEYCAEIMNSGNWIIPIDLIKNEMDAFKMNVFGVLPGATVYLYSIIKFIGQYTCDPKIFIECNSIVRSIGNVNCHNLISPEQIEHLYSFNKYFSPKHVPRPDKVKGSNRLFQFENSGICEVPSLKCCVKFRKLRINFAKQNLSKTKNYLGALYYFESMYYYGISRKLDVFLENIANQFFEKKQDRMLILSTITMLNNWYIGGMVSALPNNQFTPNEYMLENNVQKMVLNRISLIDRDSLNGQNIEELQVILNEVLSVNDTFCNSNSFYDLFRVTLFKKLYSAGILRPLDKYSTYIWQIAHTEKIYWILEFFSQIKK